MNELYVGLLVAGFSLVFQALWQVGQLFMYRRNSRKALIGELSINLELVAHNRRRAENQVGASVAFQSYIPYQLSKLTEILRDSHISIDDELRLHLQKLIVQLMHQNIIMDISKALWPLVLEKKEQVGREVERDEIPNERILQVALQSSEDLSPDQINEKLAEQNESRLMQITIANIMIGYTYDLEKMLKTASSLLR